MDATLTFIGLSTLTGIVWGLSEKDITFEALGLNAEGVLVMLVLSLQSLFLLKFVLAYLIFRGSPPMVYHYVLLAPFGGLGPLYNQRTIDFAPLS